MESENQEKNQAGEPNGGGWNFRVLRREFTDESFFQFIECYYDQQGRPNGYCEAEASGESTDSLQWILDRMREALEKPVLTEMDFYHEDER